MNIIITGSSGMLGSALCRFFSETQHIVIGVDLFEPTDSNTKPNSFVRCDITDYKKFVRIVDDIRPEVVIHTAAFTDVDGCELEPVKAETINVWGTRNVAEATYRFSADFIYISTDFIFDGQKKAPYTEKDIANPLNVYGKSKLKGEMFVLDIFRDRGFFILRTSWLFGMGGRNFVDTILEKAKKERLIKVVTDQFGSPTYTIDLAQAIGRILDVYNRQKGLYGIYHIANNGNCSWYRLAQKTLELAGIYEVELIPIVSTELDRPAERPFLSILDNSHYTEMFGVSLRAWEDALEEYLLTTNRRILNV